MASENLVQRLARIRTRLAAARGAHMIVGAGCACGLPGGHIDASSIDMTIGNYLADKYGAAGDTTENAPSHDAFGKLLNRARSAGGLSDVLREISDAPGAFEEADCLRLCEDLETALGSLEDITRTKKASSFQVENF